MKIKRNRYLYATYIEELQELDVVCHSMGYAHALGAIKVLQDIGLKIGALYCLAPEGAQFTEKNPECMEVLSKIDIKEQFGSDEIGHSILKKDYIAPQHPVPGATRHYHDLENIEGWGFWRAHTLLPVLKNNTRFFKINYHELIECK